MITESLKVDHMWSTLWTEDNTSYGFYKRQYNW